MVATPARLYACAWQRGLSAQDGEKHDVKELVDSVDAIVLPAAMSFGSPTCKVVIFLTGGTRSSKMSGSSLPWFYNVMTLLALATRLDLWIRPQSEKTGKTSGVFASSTHR